MRKENRCGQESLSDTPALIGATGGRGVGLFEDSLSNSHLLMRRRDE